MPCFPSSAGPFADKIAKVVQASPVSFPLIPECVCELILIHLLNSCSTYHWNLHTHTHGIITKINSCMVSWSSVANAIYISSQCRNKLVAVCSLTFHKRLSWRQPTDGVFSALCNLCCAVQFTMVVYWALPHLTNGARPLYCSTADSWPCTVPTK